MRVRVVTISRTALIVACGGFVLLAASFAAAPSCFAQANPSSDDIINALRPHPDQTTRGIKLLPSNGGSSNGNASAGVARVAPATPQAAGTAHAVVGSQAPGEAGLSSVDLVVQFANGSSELTPQARHALDALGRALVSDALAKYRFRVEGHTDTVGSPEYNRALSQRRAAAVAAYLAKKFAVDSARLEPVGMGSDHLLVATPAETPEPRNRRVHIVNIGT